MTKRVSLGPFGVVGEMDGEYSLLNLIELQSSLESLAGI